MAETPSYPVYRSPDGKTEQIASTPARAVQLRFEGWQLVTRPRTTAPRKTDAQKQTTTD